MSRWIDADALKAFIKDQYFHCDMPEEWGNGVMWATSQINHYCNKAPSIDIVRCKECYMCDEKMWCSFYDSIMESDDFCSYGERRE